MRHFEQKKSRVQRVLVGTQSVRLAPQVGISVGQHIDRSSIYEAKRGVKPALSARQAAKDQENLELEKTAEMCFIYNEFHSSEDGGDHAQRQPAENLELVVACST